jgi:hypothetical protein
MFTRTTWTRYDQSQLLTGGGLTGVGVEIDRRLDGLRSEAEARRLCDGTADDRRLTLGLTHLDIATRRHEAGRHATPATRTG